MHVASAATATSAVVKITAAKRRRQETYARRQARYEQAARLRVAGVSINAIARQIGAERKTIRAWLRAAGVPLWRKLPRAGVLGPYQDHLEHRWTERGHNAAQLWRELVNLGFSGRPATVRWWAGQRRKAGQATAAISPPMQPPSARQTARTLMTDTDALPETERSFISRLLAQTPGLSDCITVAKRLNTLLRRQSEESLDGVLADAADTALKEFAASLQRDIAAVRAALETPWTTSPAEGQINRLKMLKRTMYGRAGINLLRARVLKAA